MMCTKNNTNIIFTYYLLLAIGIVVYFPAVAPPDAYAGDVFDRRVDNKIAILVAVVDERKSLLPPSVWSSSFRKS